MNRFIYLLSIVIVLVVTVDVHADYLTAFNYHGKIGIPQAYAVKKYEDISSRIVGGSPTSLGAVPYHAGLVITLTTGFQSICGGSLISNIRVLTAAHCWWDGQNQGRQMTVVLGSTKIFSGGTRIVAKSVTNHANWNPKYITNDISMVTVDPVQLSNNINVVALPKTSDVQNTFAGVTGMASGFGKTSDAQSNFPPDTFLSHISLPIITNAECQKSFDIVIANSHLCTNGKGGVGTCDGDSGGPLTVSLHNLRTLVGISSFGLGSGCQRGYPSVFSRVTTFLTWIQARL